MPKPPLPLIDGHRVAEMQRGMKIVYFNDLVVVVRDVNGASYFIPRP